MFYSSLTLHRNLTVVVLDIFNATVLFIISFRFVSPDMFEPVHEGTQFRVSKTHSDCPEKESCALVQSVNRGV